MYENTFEQNILLELVSAGVIEAHIMDAVLDKLKEQKNKSDSAFQAESAA